MEDACAPSPQDVRKLLSERQRVVIVSGQARRLAEVFGDEAILGKSGVTYGLPGHRSAGAARSRHARTRPRALSRRLAEPLAGPLRLHRYRDLRLVKAPRRAAPRQRDAFHPSWPSCVPATSIVHQDHGIGRFEGLVKLNTGGVEREYLLIQYAGTDKLYIPTDQLDRITRYIGMGDAAPALSKLGGKRLDSRPSSAPKRMSPTLPAICCGSTPCARSPWATPSPATRSSPGCKNWKSPSPTRRHPTRLRAIEEVKADMERARPMDRLVCGDVGYGKTEVALRAAFKAVLDQRQVAVLVPTTVLALQHFNTFTERLKPYPVRVELLSRFRSEKEQKEVLADVAAGKVDIVVGTHRLLSKDVTSPIWAC